MLGNKPQLFRYIHCQYTLTVNLHKNKIRFLFLHIPDQYLPHSFRASFELKLNPVYTFVTIEAVIFKCPVPSGIRKPWANKIQMDYFTHIANGCISSPQLNLYSLTSRSVILV